MMGTSVVPEVVVRAVIILAGGLVRMLAQRVFVTSTRKSAGTFLSVPPTDQVVVS